MSTPTSDSPYPDSFLTQQRDRLEKEKEQVLEDIEFDEEEIMGWESGDDNDLTLGEGATAMTERQLDMGLLQNAKDILSHINDALARLDEGTYGWDAEQEVWIRQERLEALPWAEREIPGLKRAEDGDRSDEG